MLIEPHRSLVFFYLPFVFRIVFLTLNDRPLRVLYGKRIALLQHMCRLVREKSLTRACSRRILPSTKNDIAPRRISERVYRPRRLRSLGICMHAHLAEVMPKTRLHEFAGLGIERLARRAQHFAHSEGDFGRFILSRSAAL